MQQALNKDQPSRRAIRVSNDPASLASPHHHALHNCYFCAGESASRRRLPRLRSSALWTGYRNFCAFLHSDLRSRSSRSTYHTRALAPIRGRELGIHCLRIWGCRTEVRGRASDHGQMKIDVRIKRVVRLVLRTSSFSSPLRRH